MKWGFQESHISNYVGQLISETKRLKGRLARETKHADMRKYLQFTTIPNYCWRKEEKLVVAERMIKDATT